MSILNFQIVPKFRNRQPLNLLPQRVSLSGYLPTLLCLILSFMVIPDGLARSASQVPKNIIIVIGDGMGQDWVKAGRRAKGEPLSFEKFPYHTTMTVASASAPRPTDSTASATAMVTGRKVYNKVTSVALPGDGSDLKTLLEKMQAEGKSVGLITNSTFYDATPAAFAAHAPNRNQFCKILSGYFTQSRPHVIMGASKADLRCIAAQPGDKAPKRCAAGDPNPRCRDIKQMALEAGYQVIESLTELKALRGDEAHVLGAFGLHRQVVSMLPGVRTNGLPFAITSDDYFKAANIPRLPEMVEKSIAILSRNPKGFLLLVENENIDSIGHAHQLYDRFSICLTAHYCFGLPRSNDVVLAEMAEIDKTVALIDEKTKNLGSRLIIVTADHDTGGLLFNENNPQISWDNLLCSGRILNPRCLHTLQDVGLWATGQNAELFESKGRPIDNTQISSKILGQKKNDTSVLNNPI